MVMTLRLERFILGQLHSRTKVNKLTAEWF